MISLEELQFQILRSFCHLLKKINKCVKTVDFYIILLERWFHCCIHQPFIIPFRD